MSAYSPPVENVPIFDAGLFRTTNGEGEFLTIAEANKLYLQFPFGQGSETIPAVNITGTATLNTLVVGGTASFNNSALPTSLGTLPAPNTISTQIPTMDWVQQAITAGGSTILGSNNTWTGTNDFTNSNNFTYSGTLQAGTNAGNYVATNQFVQSAIVASQQQANTYAGLQETLIYSEIPYDYGAINSVAGNAMYNYGVNANSFAVSKSFNTTAYSILDAVYVNFNPTNPISALGQNTLLYLSPPPATSFEPCVLAFSADGQYAIATSDTGGTNPSEIYVMSKSAGNSGTFNAVSGVYDYFADACLSADGQYQLVAEVSGLKQCSLSSNYGSTFSVVGSVGIFFAVAMSATGKYQMAVSQFDGIHNSSDYGTTWITTAFVSNSFKKCAMSANGQYQIALCENAGADSAFMSWDYGATWTNIDAQVGGTKQWTNVGITDCGRVITAYEFSGLCYISYDYGKTFIVNAPATPLSGYSKPTFSINGKYLIGLKSGTLPYYLEFSAIF